MLLDCGVAVSSAGHALFEKVQIVSDDLSNDFTYSYNGVNELTTATQPNGASNVTYTYDMLGQMISKTQGSASATYDWHPPTLAPRYGGMLVSTESAFAGEANFLREYRGDRRMPMT